MALSLCHCQYTFELNYMSRLCLVLSLFLSSSLFAADKPVRFVNDWKWEGQSAPLLMALDKGYFADQGVDVTLEKGNGSLDAIPKVASGEFDVGSADINSLITWRDQNPEINLKAIFIIYNSPPFAVIGRPSLGVLGPLDLEGHTLGAPANDGAFAQWPALIRANGIVADKVTIQDVSFLEREALLAKGEVDAITGFSFSSYLSLQQLGVPTEDISLMLMSDFGLNLYGNAIIVNPDFAEANPEAVRAFIRGVVRGYQEAIAHPAAAIVHVLERNPEADAEIELKRLVMAIGLHIVTDEVRAFGLGAAQMIRLEKSIDQLAAVYEFNQVPSSSDIFDASFLPSLERRKLLKTVSPVVPAMPSSDSAQQASSEEIHNNKLLMDALPSD